MHSDEFAKALETQDAVMVGWNFDAQDAPQQHAAVFSLGDKGWRILAEGFYGADIVKPVRDDLAERGIRQGGFDNSSDSVWYAHEGEVGVWSTRKCLLLARNGEIASHVKKTFRYTDIICVVAYLDDDAVNRGIKLDLKSGERVTALFDISSAAALSMEYDRYDRLADTMWLIEVGNALAKCTGTYLRNELG